jgi:hypothetical protein
MEQSHVLAKTIPAAHISVVMKQTLDPPNHSSASVDESSTTSSSTTTKVTLYEDWPSKEVYDVAHGVLAYEERAVVVVSCEEASEKAPTKEEAAEFKSKAEKLRSLIDIDIHCDRMRLSVAQDIANFVNTFLEDNQDASHASESNNLQVSSDETASQRNYQQLRHGFGLYGGEVPAAIDPGGHGVIGEAADLDVGEVVLAAKKKQYGSHEAMRELVKYRVESTAAPSFLSSRPGTKQKPRPQVRQAGFTWAYPEAVAEKLARETVERGVPPIRVEAMTPGVVVGVGSAGRANTYAIEYEDGDVEVSEDAPISALSPPHTLFLWHSK